MHTVTGAPRYGSAWRSHYPLALLTLIYTLNYFDRNIFSIVLESIKADMQLTDTQLGLLGGVAFVLFYSFMGIPIAWLADRFNRRNIIAVGLAFWSLMTACTGLKVSPGQFLAELDPADHPEIITDPEQARAYAVALDGRLV